MNSILQTPHGSLAVVDAAEWRRVEESHDANGDTSIALVNFLTSTECQVFAPDSVARYKREFEAERNARYTKFVLSYEPWISWVISVRQFAGTILLGMTLISIVAGAMGLLAIGAAAILGRQEVATIAQLTGTILLGGIVCFALDCLAARLLGAVTSRRLRKFTAEAVANPRIEWRMLGLDSVKAVPAPITALVALLQERFERSELRTAYRLVFHADVALGFPYPKIASKARIVDPFLVISMVSIEDRSKFSSASIAVWDEAKFVATLHPPTAGTVSPTV